MTRRVWFFLFFAAWAAFVVTGFVRYAVLEPTDFGFTRGLNRLEAWVSWQGAALAVALPVLFIGRGDPLRILRIARWLPLAWAGLLVAAFLALFAYSAFLQMRYTPESVPATPVTPDRPVTAPAAEPAIAPPASDN